MNKENLLPVQRASQLSTTGPQTHWLIEGLWAEQAVGILGGEPKCCKSFLALDMALSIASGAHCLRQRLTIIVGAGETAEIATIADADAGDEEAGVGRLRLRRLSRENRERGGPDTKADARKNPGETRHRFLRFVFCSTGWLRQLGHQHTARDIIPVPRRLNKHRDDRRK